LRYLGRYTHRVGISNHRLVALDACGVTFRTRDGKTVMLDPVTFLGRFIEHVLPKGFVKIRHYGLHAPSHVASELTVAQAALAPKASPAPTQSEPHEGDDGWCDLLAQLARIDGVCPACGARAVVRRPLPAARAPPEAAA
jgi:hypothetical protein